MSSRSEILREVMLRTGTTQSELSRVTGVRQSSISQFLSGKVNLSDEQREWRPRIERNLARLRAVCLGSHTFAIMIDGRGWSNGRTCLDSTAC